MNFSNIRIVLVATSHPGNIGSSARALKTMGFRRLYLVSPKAFPHQKALEMAAGADDVLEEAIVTNSLDEALQGCQLILATSARPRGIPLPGLTPEECAKFIARQADNTEIAILFGREHAGLTNEELLRSHYHINIPSNPEYSSLNLSQAVQIIAYELRMELLLPKSSTELNHDRLATADEIEQFHEHLQSVMMSTKFLKTTRPNKRLLQRIRRIFSRAKLEYMEITILRGVLSHIQKALDQR
nr:TrmJ/YjtD family RNA methyltransferase [Legionella jordanis]